jgi:hypothetical protein
MGRRPSVTNEEIIGSRRVCIEEGLDTQQDKVAVFTILQVEVEFSTC